MAKIPPKPAAKKVDPVLDWAAPMQEIFYAGAPDKDKYIQGTHRFDAGGGYIGEVKAPPQAKAS
jgi:hypothetical protein